MPATVVSRMTSDDPISPAAPPFTDVLTENDPLLTVTWLLYAKSPPPMLTDWLLLTVSESSSTAEFTESKPAPLPP